MAPTTRSAANRRAANYRVPMKSSGVSKRAQPKKHYLNPMHMTVAQLKESLARRGRKVSGNKTELIERLLDTNLKLPARDEDFNWSDLSERELAAEIMRRSLKMTGGPGRWAAVLSADDQRLQDGKSKLPLLDRDGEWFYDGDSSSFSSPEPPSSPYVHSGSEGVTEMMELDEVEFSEAEQSEASIPPRPTRRKGGSGSTRRTVDRVVIVERCPCTDAAKKGATVAAEENKRKRDEPESSELSDPPESEPEPAPSPAPPRKRAKTGKRKADEAERSSSEEPADRRKRAKVDRRRRERAKTQDESSSAASAASALSTLVEPSASPPSMPSLSGSSDPGRVPIRRPSADVSSGSSTHVEAATSPTHIADINPEDHLDDDELDDYPH